jgi:signal transduction histidine kinase
MGPDALDDLTRQRQRVDLLRRRLVNVVGHELKLPVSTISGLANAMAHATDVEIRDVIGPALVRNAARLERLVDDLLLASGVMTVLPVDPPRPTPLGPALGAAWTAAGLKDDVGPAAGTAAVVSVRTGVLDRIFGAIFDNAHKYGQPPVTVAVEAGHPLVTVIVTSGGAPAAVDLDNALEPFYRGEQAVTAAPGLGVGLAVAAALAEQDGGSVAIGASDDQVVTTVALPTA